MKVKDFAKMHNVHPNTVRLWALRGLIRCSYEYRGPRGRAYLCDVDEKSRRPQLKPGPRPVEEVMADDAPPWDQLSMDQAIKELEEKQ
ncbi:MAG: hypothetical protein E7329_01580 [Clostridiales bacterium]|nr:hypothetical protein [Clostridiales bacterium]